MKIILHGASGRMGRFLTEMIAKEPDMEVVCGIDPYQDGTLPYPIYETASACQQTADVVIDFSNHQAIPAIIDYSLKHKTPLVIATTALTQECKDQLSEAATQIPVFFSANMSLGINALVNALKTITPIFDEDFNVEIIENNYTKKLDSPCGTAILLADPA